MELSKAQEIAAQIWCQPETKHIPMNVELAQAFARELVRVTQAPVAEERGSDDDNER